MSGAEDKSQKTEKATPRRKKEARKDKQTGAFKRVIDEQKKKLAERVALSLPKPKDTSGKKVTFQ